LAHCEGPNTNSGNFSNFRWIAVFKPRLSKWSRCRLLIELGISDLKDIDPDAFACISAPPIVIGGGSNERKIKPNVATTVKIASPEC